VFDAEELNGGSPMRLFVDDVIPSGPVDCQGPFRPSGGRVDTQSWHPLLLLVVFCVVRWRESLPVALIGCAGRFRLR